MIQQEKKIDLWKYKIKKELNKQKIINGNQKNKQLMNIAKFNDLKYIIFFYINICVLILPIYM